MAKLNLSQLEKLLRPKWKTGGKPEGPPPKDPRRKGVPEVGSFLAHRDPYEIEGVIKTPRKKVVILSPFMAEDKSQAAYMDRYAKRCVQDSLNRNEAPLASHSFYYSVLNTMNPIERDIGLLSQISWIPAADIVAVYSDLGITRAMQVAINTAMIRNRKIEYRVIGGVA